MNLTVLILGVLAIYMIIKVRSLSSRNKQIGEVMELMDHLDDAETFYRLADEKTASENAEFRNKVRCIKMFGDAYFSEIDRFREDLEALEPEALYLRNGKTDILNDEDSFFYLFLAIPNKLYHTGNAELIAPLYQKLDEHAEVLDTLLISKLGHEAAKFYRKEEDGGKAFFEQFLDGDYAGYRYNPQLIGIYKNIAMAFLAKLAQDAGEGIPEEYLEELRTFAAGKLGSRWTEELGITIPSVEPETVQEDDEEQSSGS